MKKVAKPGDPLLDLYTSAWYNKINKKPNLEDFRTKPSNSLEDLPIKIQVIGDFDKEIFEPVVLEEPYVIEAGETPDTSGQFTSVKCKVTEGNLFEPNHTWCVLQTPLGIDQEAIAVIQGLTWAKVNILDTDHTHVDLTFPVLQSSYAGKAELVYRPNAVGEAYCLINIGTQVPEVMFTYEITELTDSSDVVADISIAFGSPFKTAVISDTLGILTDAEVGDTGWCYLGLYNTFYAVSTSKDNEVTVATFELTGNLAKGRGQTANATITTTSSSSYPISTNIVVVSTGDWVARSGAEGLAILAGEAWRIVWVEQRAEVIIGSFSGGLGYTDVTKSLSTPEAVGNFPDLQLDTPITVANPYGMHCLDEERAICVWNDAEEEYQVIEIIPTFVRRFTFELKAGKQWPVGRRQKMDEADITPLLPCPGYSGSMPLTFDLWDKFDVAHNARGSLSLAPADTGIAEFDEDSLEWIIINITHRATHCLGVIKTTFTEAPASFIVTVSQSGCLDGSHPNDIVSGSGDITVLNLYSWEEGVEGAEIEIFRNPVTGSWIPRQMEYNCDA